MMRAYWWAVLFALLGVSPVLMAHGGRIDSIGGHSDDEGYHFHKGVLAGKHFSDKAAAIKALKKAGKPFVKLASFNIRIFSNRSRDHSELVAISKQLQPFDIIAIQEVRDSTVLDRTVVILNEKTGVSWAYLLSRPVGRGVKERYAFLYRTDRVQALDPGKVAPDPGDRFIREPYIASFQAGDFDFTLITIHTLYKSKTAPARGDEFEALGRVFLDVQAEDPSEQDVIVLGDFNDSPTSKHGPNIRFQRMLDIVTDMQCLFRGDIQTTISDTAKSLYDNICYQPQHVTEYLGEKGIVKFDETEYGNDDKKASKAVSDHRPIWANFRNDIDDD